jgi:phosphomannomutase
MSLMVSISGIRGVVGESLTPETVVKYAAAYGEYCKRFQPSRPAVMLGRDGRISGRIIANIVSSTLLSTGVDVRAIGICPTPTVQLAVEHSGAVGGISVTASHNPMQWNGMKFIAPTGMFLDADENAAVWEIAEKHGTRYAPWQSLGLHAADEGWIRKHIDLLLGLHYVKRESIAKRRFKVVLDCVNAAGGVIVPTLLQELGCDVVEMNCDVSGVFAHTPEPIPENLGDLCSRVKAEKADLGIAVDPDVDRLVLITENGEPYGEEYTIASAVRFVLEHEAAAGNRSHTVVVNLSTTRAVDDIAASFGATVVRTPVGEINVARKMRERGAVIGGEGSGGVILPAVHLGRDAVVGIGLILQFLAESGGTLSELKARLPQYSIAKGRIELAGKLPPDHVLKNIASRQNSNARVNTEDGVRIDYPDCWVHLRESNTEPIVRVIAEARDMPTAADVVAQFTTEILNAS